MTLRFSSRFGFALSDTCSKNRSLAISTSPWNGYSLEGSRGKRMLSSCRGTSRSRFAFRSQERGVAAASRRPMTLRPLVVRARAAVRTPPPSLSTPANPFVPSARRHAIAPAHELLLARSPICIRGVADLPSSRK